MSKINGDQLRPAAILDRDGVINVDLGYVYKPEDLILTPTAAEAISILNGAGYLVLVATNQSGIARGFYGTRDVEMFHDHLQTELSRSGAAIDAFYYCAFHPDGTVPEFSKNHEDRKPSPGMLVKAMKEWRIDPTRSFLIGDKESDIEAAARAGIKAFRIEPNSCDLAATVRRILSTEQ